MTQVEESIDKLIDETNDSVNQLIDGSDEHLDMILSVTKPLNNITQKFENLNELLWNTASKFSKEQKLQLLPKLFSFNRSCVTLIGAIRTCFLYRDIRESLKKFQKQYDLFREFLHDLQHLNLSEDKELDGILLDINGL